MAGNARADVAAPCRNASCLFDQSHHAGRHFVTQCSRLTEREGAIRTKEREAHPEVPPSAHITNETRHPLSPLHIRPSTRTNSGDTLADAISSERAACARELTSGLLVRWRRWSLAGLVGMVRIHYRLRCHMQRELATVSTERDELTARTTT